MSHRGRTALVTVIAIGCLAPVPASGQDRAQGDADGASTWTLPRTSRWPAGPTGVLDDPNLYPPGATRVPGREGVLHRRGNSGVPAAVDRRGGQSLGEERPQYRRRRGEREGASSDSREHPLRQRDLAGHIGAKGSLNPAHIADHGPAKRARSALDAEGRSPSGRRPGGAAAAPKQLRELRDPALDRAMHRLATRGPADVATGLQRYSLDLSDGGLRRGVHRAVHRAPAHHPARRAPASSRHDSTVRR